jgi:uncharacterized protein (DUF1778 family)
MFISLECAIARLKGQPRGKPLRFRVPDETRAQIEQAAMSATGGNVSLLILASAEAAAREINRQAAEAQTKKRTAA